MFFAKDEDAPAFVAGDPVNSLPALLARAGHLEDDDARVVYGYLKIQSELRLFEWSMAESCKGFERDEQFVGLRASATKVQDANARLEVEFLLIGWQHSQLYPQ